MQKIWEQVLLIPVSYTHLEAHTALVLLGKGEAWYQGELLLGEEALKRVGMKPMELSSKEGLALVSGTTSPTALGALALYDMLQAAKTADVIGALTVEDVYKRQPLDRQKFSESFRRNFISVIFLSPEM